MAGWARKKSADAVRRDDQLPATLSWPHLIALGVGAIIGTGIMTVTGGIKVAVLHSPQGHEIELVQLPG